MYVIVSGDLLGGVKAVVGPFEDPDKARDFAHGDGGEERFDDDSWFVCEVTDPKAIPVADQFEGEPEMPLAEALAIVDRLAADDKPFELRTAIESVACDIVMKALHYLAQRRAQEPK